MRRDRLNTIGLVLLLLALAWLLSELEPFTESPYPPPPEERHDAR